VGSQLTGVRGQLLGKEIHVSAKGQAPSFVATLERLEIFMATRRAKVSSGFKGSGSLSYHEDLDWFSIAFYKTPESAVFSAQ